MHEHTDTHILEGEYQPINWLNLLPVQNITYINIRIKLRINGRLEFKE